jgi:divalent metal cation (Fe/Co/Zn/Cd) transporter
VDLHVIVDGNLTVTTGHKIGHDVKDAIMSHNKNIRDVLVHIEPGE